MTTGYVGPGQQWVSAADVPNRPLAGGDVAIHSAVLSADGVVYAGPCVFYGLQVVTAGTSVIVYDSITATGVAVMNGIATTTAGAMVSPAGVGVGVRMDAGIYIDLTLGTYIAFYLPL